ncbi:major pollen allergen Art v 1-like [Hordeum vulgare subsp. vulgare]|uniref:major pollen allergen Art v 1-like n=1 Tax=Hordeum vulgare subsp. vulgare TaxID=112509 RepID=UPI001B858ED6|nr:major pollen allergen Art v 1-like [Hordeum vulgare subsp. vulgare]
MAFSGAQMLAAFTLAFLLMAFCAEARVCMSPSKLYKGKGPCKNVRCTATCHKEHFKGGFCYSKKSLVGDELNEDNDNHIFRKPPKKEKEKKKCMYTFPCGKGPAPPSEPDVPEPPPAEPELPEPPSKGPTKKPPPPPYERDM